MFGYHGQFLDIDLGGPCGRPVPLSADALRSFIGGAGLGVYLLHHYRAAQFDPLEPEAPLVFAFSPLVGSPLTTSAKLAVVCKSPLTERINDALASSRFALTGKRTGHDALVIHGRAPCPSVLLIDGGDVRLEPAAEIWGTTTTEAEQRLGERFGSAYQFAVIGPAGEQGVRYASLSHDGRHAGRGGSGAVLGAKNIKAIGVRGEHHADWADLAGLVLWAKKLADRSSGAPTAKYRELGTAGNVLLFNRLGTLPTRNFCDRRFEGADKLAPENLATTRAHTRASCAACTIGCEHRYQLSSSEHSREQDVRLEYETLFALGSLCGINDAETVLQAARRCDDLGLDTISTGGTIAFAMECAERGLWDVPWLRFGDGPALLRAIDLIGRQKGIGRWLGEGSRRLADRLGGTAHTFAPHVKGMELPGYDPRTLQTMALGLAVAARGADHNRSSAYEADFAPGAVRGHLAKDAARQAIETEDRAALLDSLILCKFVRGALGDLYEDAATMMRLITGWHVTPGELRTVAKRIVTARKWFNIQCGWSAEEDDLPDRFFQPSTSTDEGSLSRENLRRAITRYNQLRGWSADGWIPDEQLRSLCLLRADAGRQPAAASAR